MKGRRHLHNVKRYKERRHDLRRNLTPPEAFLWNYLKGSNLEGKKFRRQHGIGPYIVDSYCPECRVIVELDGAGHEDVLRAEGDARRRLYLENLGIKILRFENKVVFEDIELVLNTIRAGLGVTLPSSAEGWLRDQEKARSNLSSRRRGGAGQ